jgi:hypothetical protein
MALPARRVGFAGSTETIATVLGGFSLEATFPKPAEIDALKRTAPAGTRVYLSCLPNRSPEKLVEYASNVRAAGFEPVPHITARVYESREAVDRLLRRLVNEAGVRSALVIAGDRDDVAGPFTSALDLIEKRTESARSTSPPIPTAIRRSMTRSCAARSRTSWPQQRSAISR